ncbi:hypothetical protein DVA67_010355 [Solirubrobacter sp. CPCC 204708]|uniref:Uncharacterized protein n=1 Tax=Solirubrobacter deserti TaxID=2282478 RepID=A0ABT4RSM8_9ACTN|nr:hypothetical protein [Solirubrobacter deserti]MBE2316379.1 hypothetical protein [Solirubrobacter deserti]MDA0141541.1 hypothetical protein [Solirubrobacter deserti]
MKRVVVIVVTGLAAWTGCAASSYKFSCTNRVCEVETSGPAELDFEEEYGETVEVVETRDGRVTLQAGTARATLRTGQNGALGALKVDVSSVKGERAYFTLRP